MHRCLLAECGSDAGHVVNRLSNLALAHRIRQELFILLWYFLGRQSWSYYECFTSVQ